MAEKKPSGLVDWVDPDDAPELTAELLSQAEVFQGDIFVRRGRGRLKAEVVKQLISVRLDPDIVAKLREAGPGWRSQINALLRQSLGLGKTAAASGAIPPGADAPCQAESPLDPVDAGPPPVASRRG